MRITAKDLERLVDQLNEITGNPTATYTKDASGEFHANIGNYHIDGAYGGVKLVQLSNESGGIIEISKNGFGTKRQLYDFLNAYISGFSIQQKKLIS